MYLIYPFVCLSHLVLVKYYQWGKQPDSSTSLSWLPLQDVRPAGLPLLQRSVRHQARWLPGKTKTWQTLQVIICVHAHNPDLSSVWITTSFVWSHAAGSKSSALSFLSTATEINLLVLFKGVKKGHFKFLLSRLKGKKKKGDLRKYAESLPVTDCLPSISLHITRINSLLFMRLNRDHFYKLVRSMTLDFDFLPVPASMQSSANCLLGAITSHST